MGMLSLKSSAAASERTFEINQVELSVIEKASFIAGDGSRQRNAKGQVIC